MDTDVVIILTIAILIAAALTVGVSRRRANQ
jgi:hypothetical protein